MTRRMIYALTASYVVAFAFSLVSAMWAANVDAESNRRWCSLLVVLDDTYQQTPPQTDVGRNVASEIHRLRTDFEC